MKHKEFIKKLVETFPEVKDQITDEDISDSITMQMGAFKRFTQNAIDSNNVQTVKRCFDFISLYVDKVDNRIRNSIGITYAAKLVLKKNTKLEKMLPENLRKIREDIKERYKSIGKNEEFQQFFKDLKKRL